MRSYIVTGATGFVGRHVIERLLEADDQAVVYAIVAARSRKPLLRLAAEWKATDRVVPLIGDLADPDFRIDGEPPLARNIVHCSQEPGGTANIVSLARRCGAMLHHVSSIAVAGDYSGTYGESDFDLGQEFSNERHRALFETEKLVRETADEWRVYRPGVIVGHSRTGAMDDVTGPYHFFGALSQLSRLPGRMPVVLPDLGSTNLVPVDYVAAAIVELVLCDGRSGDTFHLVNPTPQPIHHVYGALAAAAGAPASVLPVPGTRAPLAALRSLAPVAAGRDMALRSLGIPQSAIDDIRFSATFKSTATRTALRRDRTIAAPDFADYAAKLWQYWTTAMDPGRLRRTAGPDGFRGRVVVITGGSSGIGLASARAVARRGATVAMLARGVGELDEAVAAIRAEGGDAHGYPCDVTDHEAVAIVVKTMLAEHGHVDYLVNNAGRSIRRSVVNSTERMHDFERTMAVNYFGAVRLVLALLPSMRERGFGHIVNVSSIGVQTKAPLFSAYVASKSALDAFSTIAAAENLDAGITFTSIRMPLVRTPMIAPTTAYATLPVDSPDDAAVRVVRALEDRPDRIDTPVGTLAEAVGYLAPSIRKAILHQVYRAFPESSAAKGEATERKPATPSLAAKALSPLMAFPAPSLGLAKWIPGLHW